jgi:hypothetical protein
MFHRIISNTQFNVSIHHDTSHFILEIKLNISQETHFNKDNGSFLWVLLNANILKLKKKQKKRERESVCEEN